MLVEDESNRVTRKYVPKPTTLFTPSGRSAGMDLPLPAVIAYLPLLVTSFFSTSSAILAASSSG